MVPVVLVRHDEVRVTEDTLHSSQNRSKENTVKDQITTSVRIDPEDRDYLRLLAEAEGVSVSDKIREAVSNLIDTEIAGPQAAESRARLRASLAERQAEIETARARLDALEKKKGASKR